MTCVHIGTFIMKRLPVDTFIMKRLLVDTLNMTRLHLLKFGLGFLFHPFGDRNLIDRPRNLVINNRTRTRKTGSYTEEIPLYTEVAQRNDQQPQQRQFLYRTPRPKNKVNVDPLTLVKDTEKGIDIREYPIYMTMNTETWKILTHQKIHSLRT